MRAAPSLQSIPEVIFETPMAAKAVAPIPPPVVEAEPGAMHLPGLDADEQSAVALAVEVLGDRALHAVGGHRLPVGFKVSVLMPVYNECGTIEEILRRVRAVPLPLEIIVVDDFSTDGTRQMLREMPPCANVRVLFHEHNQGKGAAVRTALAAATGDVVLIQDADLEYDPREYARLIEPIVAGWADVVYGSRFLGNGPGHPLFWHRQANRLLTLLSNWFTGLRITDMETCHKVFCREALEGISIQQDRFGLEPELTAKIARKRCRVVELPTSYQGRATSEGKKIGLKDAFNALWCIVRYSLAE